MLMTVGAICLIIALVMVVLEFTTRAGPHPPIVWAVVFIVVALLLLHLPVLVVRAGA